QDWISPFAKFEPSLPSMLMYAMRDVTYTFFPRPDYMPFLWTMPIEWLGSILVFGILLAYERLKKPDLCIAAVAVILIAMRVYVGCFLLGMLLGRMRSVGFFDNLRSSIGPRFSFGLIL